MTVLRPHPQPVALGDLPLPGEPVGDLSLTVTGVTLDSRLVQCGDLYVALPGAKHHGAQFVDQAAAQGATAVLTDPAGAALLQGGPLPVVVVDEPRRGLAGVAAAAYGHPAEAMSMLAITGTNGKTTTAYLLDAALRAVDLHTGLIGTIGFALDGTPLEGVRTTVTTPESTELQGLLGHLRDAGAEAVVMEVSSHALVLGRADAIRFDVAAFTNLGRDHLDFHGDVESYFEAKASLFTAERTRHAVVSLDDPFGLRLAERIAATGEVGLTTVGLSADADCVATAYGELGDGRLAVSARLHGQRLDFVCSLPGRFNVRNALTALVMIEALGLDVERAATGLADATVPGRMQRVDPGPGGPLVFVDFAHTPQAVSAVLEAITRPEGFVGRRIVVLGCGGDRDASKRRPMGSAAAVGADVVVVTDDNPRSEAAADIRAEVLAGARETVPRRALEILDGGDRRSAIALALGRAGPDDVVAVLGKGHETGQEIAGVITPFSDPEVVVEEWSRLSGRAVAR